MAENIKVSYEFDQSPYVTRAIGGLRPRGRARRAAHRPHGAAVPARLAQRADRRRQRFRSRCSRAVVGAVAHGQTINIMTLGGLALAVGILVDEATVVIENIHTHSRAGKRVARAVLDASARGRRAAAARDALRARGVHARRSSWSARRARCSCRSRWRSVSRWSRRILLSSTLVPDAVRVALARSRARGRTAVPERGAFARVPAALRARAQRASVRARWRRSRGLSRWSQRARDRVGRACGSARRFSRRSTPASSRCGSRADGHARRRHGADRAARARHHQGRGRRGQRRDHARASSECTRRTIRSTSSICGTAARRRACCKCSSSRASGVAIEPLKSALRKVFAEQMPDVSFSFEPSDIVSQVMSLGSPTPIEVAVSGPNLAANREFADKRPRAARERSRRCATCSSARRSITRRSTSRSIASAPG